MHNEMKQEALEIARLNNRRMKNTEVRILDVAREIDGIRYLVHPNDIDGYTTEFYYKAPKMADLIARQQDLIRELFSRKMQYEETLEYILEHECDRELIDLVKRILNA